MSPKRKAIISDFQSDMIAPQRGRPPVPPLLVLEATARLFARANSSETVTMDAIAAEAQVGKGTLFRAFGNREGLLNALWTRQISTLHDQVEDRLSPHSGESVVKQAVAFLDALLCFKRENVHLIQALELGRGVLQSDHYKWMHGLLVSLIKRAQPNKTASEAIYIANMLLAGLHIGLIENMVAGGISFRALRRMQAEHVEAVVSGMSPTKD